MRPLVGAACAGAAARLLGIVSRDALVAAITDEIAPLGPAVVAESRTRAQALIRAGRVLVDDVPSDKPGTRVRESAAVRVRGEDGFKVYPRTVVDHDDLTGIFHTSENLLDLSYTARYCAFFVESGNNDTDSPR